MSQLAIWAELEAKTRKRAGGVKFSEIGAKHGGTRAGNDYVVRDEARRDAIRNFRDVCGWRAKRMQMGKS